MPGFYRHQRGQPEGSQLLSKKSLGDIGAPQLDNLSTGPAAEAAGLIVAGDSGKLHRHDDALNPLVFDAAVRSQSHRFLVKLRRSAE